MLSERELALFVFFYNVRVDIVRGICDADFFGGRFWREERLKKICGGARSPCAAGGQCIPPEVTPPKMMSSAMMIISCFPRGPWARALSCPARFDANDSRRDSLRAYVCRIAIPCVLWRDGVAIYRVHRSSRHRCTFLHPRSVCPFVCHLAILSFFSAPTELSSSLPGSFLFVCLFSL